MPSVFPPVRKIIENLIKLDDVTQKKNASFTFLASFSAFCFSFSSIFLHSFLLLSFDETLLAGFDIEADVFDVLGAEETVYGLKPRLDDDGFTLAGWEFDLFINVDFDMIGATFELFMLSFFVALVGAGAVDVDGSSSSGTISESFIAFDDDV